MRQRRTGVAAAFAALAIVAWEHRAAAGPAVRLHIADGSTCEGTAALATRLTGKGIALAGQDPAAPVVDVDVRAVTTAGGAEAEMVIRAGGQTSTRALTAPTCDEVLDALVFTLGLALEQPVPPPPPAPPAPPAAPAPGPSDKPPGAEAPASSVPAPSEGARGIGWGFGATGGVLAGMSPTASPAIAVHVDLESRSASLFAPALVLGGAIVLPSSTSSSGGAVDVALQMGTLHGCPLRLSTGRFALRPCVELQLGRLQTRSSGFPSARLDESLWAALAVDLRGRVEVPEIAPGLHVEIDASAGSPLIQDVVSIGDQRIFAVGALLVGASAGVGVHFP